MPTTSSAELAQQLQQAELRRKQLSQPTELESLDGTIKTLEDALERAQLQESRELILDRLSEHAKEAAEALSQFAMIKTELAAILAVKLAAMDAAKARLMTARNAFVAEANRESRGAFHKLLSFRVHPEEARRLQAEMDSLLSDLQNRGADVGAVLAEDFGSDRTAADRPLPRRDQSLAEQLVLQCFATLSGEAGHSAELERARAIAAGKPVQ